jgi:hypothetical protein
MSNLKIIILIYLFLFGQFSCQYFSSFDNLNFDEEYEYLKKNEMLNKQENFIKLGIFFIALF